MTQTANNYGEVLYDLGISREIVEETKRIFSLTTELPKVLNSPVVTLKEKKRLIDVIFPEEIRNFLKVLCDYGSVSQIADIFTAYENCVDARSGILRATLFYVTPPTDSQLTQIKEYLARKYNETTTFGKFMDPLADKLLVCSALICFAADPNCVMPVWVAIIIIAREFIISGFRLVAVEKGIVIAANYWGKVKTVVQMVMSIVLIFDFSCSYIAVIEWVLVWAAVALTIISLIDYIYKNRIVLSDKEIS